MSAFFSKRRVSFLSGALLSASLVAACSTSRAPGESQGLTQAESRPSRTARADFGPKDAPA
ncbi:MAG: hypothetical protein EOO71_13055, partial [Myxococcaceae bacterium]